MIVMKIIELQGKLPEEYKDNLEKEAKGVEERINELKKNN